MPELLQVLQDSSIFSNEQPPSLSWCLALLHSKGLHSPSLSSQSSLPTIQTLQDPNPNPDPLKLPALGAGRSYRREEATQPLATIMDGIPSTSDYITITCTNHCRRCSVQGRVACRVWASSELAYRVWASSELACRVWASSEARMPTVGVFDGLHAGYGRHPHVACSTSTPTAFSLAPTLTTPPRRPAPPSFPSPKP